METSKALILGCGLREDAEILFVLTTNRPEHIESALAARPGRIDQSIEFPLPDDEGRRQLVRLYAGALEIREDVVERIVQKPNSFSRRVERGLASDHVDAALEEMLFQGGSLNAKLLGGVGVLRAGT